MARGQRVLYVTERAVFELTSGGLALREVAPGIDRHADLLDMISWPVEARHVHAMDEALFTEGPGARSRCEPATADGLRLSKGVADES